MISNIETKTGISAFSESNRKILTDRLAEPCNVLIMSHKHPDGDAVGSAFGLAAVLESLGHEVKVYIPDEAPDFLKWMPGYEKVGVFEKSSKSFPGLSGEPDLVFFLDFNSPERLGKMAKDIPKLSGLKMLIDHHPAQDPFYDLGIVDTSKGSTCELVYLFLEDIGFIEHLDKNSATCLYAGIITDTLGLQVSSSYPGVFRVVGKLIETGIDMNEVFSQIYHQFSAERMQLLGYCLAEKLTILPEFKVAYIWLSKSELAKFKHLKGDTEGFVNYPLSIKGVEFTVLFTELDGEIKLSLRSKGDIPVNEFAAQFFDGGGHKNASGGRSSLTMEKALEYFEASVKGFMTDHLTNN